MSTIKLLRSWDTEYSADSVEWCPNSKFHNLFVCGTYKLEQGASPDNVEVNQQRRIGRLYLFSCQNVEPYLVKEQTIEIAAILDCKWCPVEVSGRILLAVADADGKVSIYQLEQGGAVNNSSFNLNLLVEKFLPVCEESKLSLSIDWSSRLHCDNCDEVHLAVSDSKGSITVFLLSNDVLEVIHHWKAHEYEAWIVSYNHWDTSVIYTGGDDCKFCVYDMRCGTDHPVRTNRLHSAGVTSMHYSPHKDYLFSSGSYDENILLWDTRQMKSYIGSINVGGGVWRLKWEPEKGRHLLAACMYNGFHVVDCLDTCSPKIVAEFTEHKSIAYGSDWCHSTGIPGEKFKNFISSSPVNNDASDINAKLIGTCSFYDHKLCVSLFVE